MDIAIDQGNTLIKLGFFSDGQIVRKMNYSSVEEVIKTVETSKPENIVLASVGKDGNHLLAALERNFSVLQVSSKIPLPFFIKYKTPETLGADRIAMAAATSAMFPNHNCLAISLGTCITYNIIDRENFFLGGAISPGVRMKLKAMHNFTDRLPLVEVKDYKDIVGQTTEESILAGAILGTLSEVEGMIENYLTKFAGLKVLICGGDVSFFETKIKASIFVSPDLILFGLHRILQYNVSK